MEHEQRDDTIPDEPPGAEIPPAQDPEDESHPKEDRAERAARGEERLREPPPPAH